ncbi:MAG: hypothetical protein OEZ54_04425 [Gemmatimonadota bacterium]|nr:hypothetical protein [Gemmatimonadota bacterium]
MFGPGVISCALKAYRKGYRQTGVEGNPKTMPALFLMRGTEIIGRHDYRHIGDRPDFVAVKNWM